MSSESPDPVTVEIRDGVATLRWHRPERRNAIGLQICARLTTELAALAGRTDVAVVLVDSADGPFCAGFDLTDLAVLDGSDEAGRYGFFAAGRDLLAALRGLPQPVVAAPRGYALGFGCAVLARCDLVLAQDTSTFGIPEIRAGVVPLTVLPDLLAVMPARTVSAWALDGAQHSAAEAERAGLVTAVVPADRHPAALDRLLADLVRAGDLARRAKHSLHELVALAPGDRTERAVALAVADAARRSARSTQAGAR